MLNTHIESLNDNIHRLRIESLIQTVNDKLKFEERLFLEDINDTLCMFGSLSDLKAEQLRLMYVKYSN